MKEEDHLNKKVRAITGVSETEQQSLMTIRRYEREKGCDVLQYVGEKRGQGIPVEDCRQFVKIGFINALGSVVKVSAYNSEAAFQSVTLEPRLCECCRMHTGRIVLTIHQELRYKSDVEPNEIIF